jgi:demethylmenaquinone methyltransferase/2-methoxy-6-polyprenyl-1,4-benzoquinol methylase
MFSAIAPRYDLLNHVLSLNLDRLWRRRTVRLLGWERAPDGAYLDQCAGTLDLAAALARQDRFTGSVVGADFVLPMLQLGRHKSPQVIPLNADALVLPFPDEVFDGATVGFGVRNLIDLGRGFRETVRVLKPGARYVVLELSTPRDQPMRGAYLLYFQHLLPRIGRAVSKHTNAYSWLPASVKAFPEPDALAAMMEASGFEQVSYDLLFGGACAIHVGTKPLRS